MSNVVRSQLEALKLVVEAIPLAISWASLSDQKILYMNRAFTRLFGYEQGDIATVPEWFSTYTDHEQRQAALRDWAHLLVPTDDEQSPADKGEVTVWCKDGSKKTVRHEAVRLPKAGWVLATFVEVEEGSTFEAGERAEREKQILYRLFFDSSEEMIVVSPRDRSKRFVSPGVMYVTGHTPEEYLAQDPDERVHPQDRSTFLDATHRATLGEPSQTLRCRLLQKDGSYRWAEAHVHASRDPQTGEVGGYIASLRNISVQRALEEALVAENRRLSQLAAVDELTGIANRRMFNYALAAEIGRQSRSESPVSLLILDVDDFKGYNDVYGHLQGDVCLRRIAEALQSVLRRPSDLVARFGGEEFVLLLPLTDKTGAEKIACDAIAAIAALSIPHSTSITGIVTVSVGVASWPKSRPLTEAEFLGLADRALYAAKRAGRNTYSVAEVDPP